MNHVGPAHNERSCPLFIHADASGDVAGDGASEALDVHIFGTDGTIRLRQPVGGALALSAGKRGKGELEPVEVDPTKRGGWRVEEEFVNSVRGIERVTHTDFFTGVKYMEWTTAVSQSLHKCRVVLLPL